MCRLGTGKGALISAFCLVPQEKSRSSAKFKDTIEQTASRTTPLWLEVNKDEYSAKVVRMPSIEDIDYEVAPPLIVELYSK